MGRYAATEPAPRVRRHVNSALLALLFAVAVAVVVIDQVTKILAVEHLSETRAVPLIGSFISLQLTYNPGAALSFASGSTWVFTIIAIVVAVVVIRISSRIGSRWWAVCLGLLLGGAVGNLIDRLFREPGFAVGHVVDFINYNGWFIGNIADIAIVLAAVGIAVLAVVGIETDGSRMVTARTVNSKDEAEGAPKSESAPSPEEAGVAESSASEVAEDAVDDEPPTEVTPEPAPIAEPVLGEPALGEDAEEPAPAVDDADLDPDEAAPRADG